MLALFIDKDLAYKLESDVVEGNRQLIEAWNHSNAKTKAKELEIGNVLAVYGSSDCPINETVGLGITSPVDESTLNQIEDFYRDNNHPSVIRVCPLADPSLIELTKKKGYTLNSFSYRWFLDLEEWKSFFKELDPRVKIAKNNEKMEWARTVASGFEDIDEVSEEYNLDLEEAFFSMRSSIPVLAYENNIVGAGGILTLNDQVAALFSTSTRHSFRKKGLQTALIDWRLRYAKDIGAKVATIETEPGSDSQRNVERMGFRLAYVTAELVKPL